MKRFIGLVLAGLVAFSATAPAVLAGNNGTLKVHEVGTPSGTESNDPKVCKFDIEGFKFDAGQVGYLLIEGQGQTSASYGPFEFGPADSEGYYQTQTFNDGGVVIADGHYKATLYGKEDLEDDKAKSKVFKVQCSAQSSPTPTPTPSPTPTPTPTPSATPSQGPLPSAEPSSPPRSLLTLPPTDTASSSQSDYKPDISFMLLVVGLILAGGAALFAFAVTLDKRK